MQTHKLFRVKAFSLFLACSRRTQLLARILLLSERFYKLNSELVYQFLSLTLISIIAYSSLIFFIIILDYLFEQDLF